MLSLALHLHCVESSAPPTQKWLSTLYISEGKLISYKSIILNHFSVAVWCIIHTIVELPIKIIREICIPQDATACRWLDNSLLVQLRHRPVLTKKISACAVEDFMSIYPDRSLKEEFSSSSKLFYIYHWTPPTWVMWKMTFKTKSINMTFCTLPFSSGDVVRILIMQHFLAISLVIYHALTKKKKKNCKLPSDFNIFFGKNCTDRPGDQLG